MVFVSHYYDNFRNKNQIDNRTIFLQMYCNNLFCLYIGCHTKLFPCKGHIGCLSSQCYITCGLPFTLIPFIIVVSRVQQSKNAVLNVFVTISSLQLNYAHVFNSPTTDIIQPYLERTRAALWGLICHCWEGGRVAIGPSLSWGGGGSVNCICWPCPSSLAFQTLAHPPGLLAVKGLLVTCLRVR